jgi:catechol 2,3-dioxygenase-like lactoylglutathione lyase family enzyme
VPPKLVVEQYITFIYVKDLERTSQFYEEVMGFPLILDQGGCRIVKIAGDTYLGYCAVSDRARGGEGVLLTLVTSQVDEWFEHLTGKGVNVLGQPKSNPDYGIYHFFLLDPDGYKLEVQQFDDPNWNAF